VRAARPGRAHSAQRTPGMKASDVGQEVSVIDESSDDQVDSDDIFDGYVFYVCANGQERLDIEGKVLSQGGTVVDSISINKSKYRKATTHIIATRSEFCIDKSILNSVKKYTGHIFWKEWIDACIEEGVAYHTGRTYKKNSITLKNFSIHVESSYNTWKEPAEKTTRKKRKLSEKEKKSDESRPTMVFNDHYHNNAGDILEINWSYDGLMRPPLLVQAFDETLQTMIQGFIEQLDLEEEEFDPSKVKFHSNFILHYSLWSETTLEPKE